MDGTTSNEPGSVENRAPILLRLRRTTDWLRGRTDGGSAKTQPNWIRRLRTGTAIAIWAYLGVSIALWILLRAASEHWWIATLILFGPRWTAILPAIVLFPAVLWLRRRSLAVLLAATGIVLVPVMGFRLPYGRFAQGSHAGQPLRVVTCNMHRHALNFLAFGTFLQEAEPDVVVLQEWSSAYDLLFATGDWNVHRDGELFLASRFPIERIEDLAQHRWGDSGAAVCYVLKTPSGPLEILNVHLASPHGALEDVLDRSPGAAAAIQANSDLRLRQSMFLTEHASVVELPLLIAGDFNTPGQSSIFHRCWWGLTDAYSSAGFGLGYTYYSRRNAVRIDHVLYNARWTCRHCEVGPDVGSPHRPVLAELSPVK